MRARAFVLSLLLMAAGCSSADTPSGPAGPGTPPSSASVASATQGRTHAPIVLIVMENRDAAQIVGSPDAPYLNETFLPAGTRFSDYSAIGHPSLPNYLAMTSGSTQGCTGDACPTGAYGVDNVFSQFGPDGWRTYAEDMPEPCARTDSGAYVTRHNPAVYYTRIADAECRRNDVALPASVPRPLASFTFVTPNLCHDMHDCGVADGDAWLAQHVPMFLAAGAVVVVVFDEGETSDLVFAAASGPGIMRGVVDGTAYTHYGLLAGIEQAFGLPRLGQAATATPMPL